MIVTSIHRLAAFWQVHADARKALTAWLIAARAAHWCNLKDLRENFAAHADAVMLESGVTVTIFNIRGNRYRLIATVDYRLGSVNVLDVMTHAEYDKQKWKNTL